MPLPGEYTLAPGEISRGGSQVRITDIVPGDYPLIQEPLLGGGGVVGRANRAGVSRQGLQFDGVGGGMPGLGMNTRAGFGKQQ